jgi:hypothetical protein
MQRREFITLLGSAATWPVAARAQQGERMQRIGVLMGGAETDLESHSRMSALQQGLEKLGWKVGRNLRIDYRWTMADLGRVLINPVLQNRSLMSASLPKSDRIAATPGNDAKGQQRTNALQQRCRLQTPHWITASARPVVANGSPADGQ